MTRKFLLLLLCSTTLFLSCSKNPKQLTDYQTENPLLSGERTEYVVSNSAANYYSRVAYYRYSLGNLTGFNEELVPEITDSAKIVDSLGNVVMHLYQFGANEGYVLLSADFREEPVLAYSNTFYLDIDPENILTGLDEWIEHRTQMIVDLRSTDNPPSNEAEQMWSNLALANLCQQGCPNYPCCLYQPQIGCDELPCMTWIGSGGPPCVPTVTSISPLLSTTWGQGCWYNYDCPIKNETCYCSNRTPTGCVATAMAQIMRYHEFPSTYNWTSMQSFYTPFGDNMSSPGAVDVADLMRNIGNSVNMDYDCDVSSANTTSSAPIAFISDFGYTSATSSSSFSTSTALFELGVNMPFIISGGKVKYWLGIIPIYYKGHAWVCDGYNSYNFCTYTTIHYHMNWGWDGANNGYYSYGSFSPGNSSYNYKNKMVYNIRP